MDNNVLQIPPGMFLMRDPVSQQTIGPLRKDQLFIHGITASSPIKTEGMSNYEKAYLVPELQVLFSKEEKAIAAGGSSNSSFSSLSKVFAFLLDCLVYLVKALVIVAISPFLPIYFLCHTISSNNVATIVFQIIGTIFIIFLIPITLLPYVAGFFILTLLVFMLCKILDVKDTIAALSCVGILPIPYIVPNLFAFGVLPRYIFFCAYFLFAFGSELILSRILPEEQESSSNIVSTILFVVVSLILLPFYAPAILFYQCARDRI